jgi:hypothetical protein
MSLGNQITAGRIIKIRLCWRRIGLEYPYRRRRRHRHREEERYVTARQTLKCDGFKPRNAR